jgi:hypothetical protein
MPDQLLFYFQGGLAEQNRMDFYEAARFQYAAARLSVKLDQFRKTGRFSKRITSESRTNIDLFPFERGSFNLKIAATDEADRQPKIDVPLTALWTYVIERVFQPVETSAALDLIDDNSLRSEFFQLVEDNIFDSSQAIDLLRKRIESDRGLAYTESELLSRLISEAERRAYLASHRDLLSQITPEQDAALVTMATPLLSEIAVPLRRSAKLVTISTIDQLGKRPILTANHQTASALESIKIDKHVSTIDVDIVQYNKETGWGKFRNEYWEGIPSFSVPADRKDDLRFELLSAMQSDQVIVDAYIVRSLSDEPIRLIIVDLRRIEDME